MLNIVDFHFHTTVVQSRIKETSLIIWTFSSVELLSSLGGAYPLSTLTLLPQIWVCSPHNASGYYGLRDEINDALSLEHFRASLNGSGDKYARTGYLGFMMKSDKVARNGGDFSFFLPLLLTYVLPYHVNQL